MSELIRITCVHGVRSDGLTLACVKCAPAFTKKIQVDTKIRVGPSLEVPSTLRHRTLDSLPRDGRGAAVNQPPSDSGAFGDSCNKLADATQLQMQRGGKKCVFCGELSEAATLGMECCRRCHKRVNGYLAKQKWYPGPCLGADFVAAKAHLQGKRKS